MTMGLIILYWVLLIAMGAGIIGAFIPAFPGIGLIVAAITIWGLVAGFSQSVYVALGIAIAIFAISTAIDYLAGYLGARQVGASKWGQTGAVVGMVLGLLGLLPALPLGGPIFGLIFGSMAGAFIGEMLYRRDLPFGPRCKLGAKVSLAIVVSSLLGNVIAGGLAAVATLVFVAATWPDVMTSLSSLGHSFTFLDHPFTSMGNPFKSLGNPFTSMGNPFKSLGNPFTSMGNPFTAIGNPFADIS